ncbi:alpha-(1,3)-fucosyltransferase 11-like [Paramuricea clavata]|uniref:Fucosyltransferase n=1 Tax=Paramuricea clavata TaxID=317549 RepID=A0A7D9JUN0_PARCT|nr:alpha-(1,3)-fucosyltransferase 11-like [Paramuricea clavata]
MQSATPSALKVTFYGMVILTFIGILLFAFIVTVDNNETNFGDESKDLTKREQSDEINKSTTRKVVILYWSRVFSATPNVNSNPDAWPFFYAGNNCPIPCELTTDKKRVEEASALVVHARNTNEIPPKIYKHLTWILHTNENPNYTPSLRDPNIMKQFNYFASYRLDSDFPCPEFVKPTLEPPVPLAEKNGLIIAIFSNCEPVRTRYLAELMKYIKVDSYGGCLRNKDSLVRKGKMNSRHAVTELQRNYKFSIVFPNADCAFYMTEKIHSALSAGSVPIWLGTDGIDEVLRWGNLKHSVIKVKDFSSPKALAEYLAKLAKNETEYNKYLKWKYQGFQFPKEYYKSAIGQWWDGLPLYCRVCLRVSQDPQGRKGLPVDRCDGPDQRRTIEKWLQNATLKV